MRRTFVGDVSHELRTPIASIAAAAETLADGSPDPAETAELLGLIRRQSDRMRELIDDLMDLAQIESGAVPLVREEIPLHELLSEVAEDLGSAARERRVDVRVLGDVSVSAVGDRRRLGQLARNLIDNAIKFSPEGAPVVVRVWRQGGRAGFSVEDLGPGIPRPSATGFSGGSTRSTARARKSGPARASVSRSSSTSHSSTALPSTSKARSARGASSTSAFRRWRRV